MISWMKVLAAMIFLQAPGKSIYSTVPTTEDGAPAVLAEVNGTKAYTLLLPDQEVPNQCTQPGNVACYKPRKRDVVIQLRPMRTEWQRTETYDEGVRRYATLAKAIAEVLNEGEWEFPPSQMWKYLLSIAYHESGFRRDIHTGIGAWAIGDCSWRTERRGDKKERVRIPGTCKSHGPFQTLFADPQRTKIFGFKAREIVGDDLESSKRAVTVAAKHLERMHAYCTKYGPRPYASCVFSTYGGVSTGSDKRIRARIKTLNKLPSAPPEPNEYVLALVETHGGGTSAMSARDD